MKSLVIQILYLASSKPLPHQYNDGIANCIDTDDDNDGITSDQDEIVHAATDSLDATSTPLDTDSDWHS